MTSRDRIPEHPGELVLLDYLVGQLPEEMKDQVRRHVGSCRACRQTMQDLSTIVDDFDRLPLVAIPHDSPRGLALRLRRRSKLRTILPGALLLAIALAATIVMGVFREQPGTPSDPNRTLRLTLDESQPQATLAERMPASYRSYKILPDPARPDTYYVLVPDSDIDAIARDLSAAETTATGPYTVIVLGTGAHVPVATGPATATT